METNNMYSNTDLEKFKKILFECAKEEGFTSYEISYGSSENFEVRIFKGEILEYKNSISRGVSFRGIFEGKMGYSSSARIDEAAVNFLIDQAKQNALIKENEDEFLYTGDDSYEKVPGISPNIFKPSVEQKIEWAKEMESYAKSLDSRVISIDSCVVSNSSSKGSLVNSYGLDLSSESGQAFCYIYVRVKQKEEVKTGVKIFASRDFEDFDPKKLAKEAVEIALSKLGAILPKSDKYNVIIENKAFINLFSVFSSNFYAENIQRGVSLLKGKLGEKVASEKLTIKDDYKHNKSIQAKAFDSEGVKTKNKIVVENGVLKTFLYNLKSAKKDGVKPTGNGTRGGTGVVNFYIEPSKNSLNYLFEKMQNGIIITSFAGLHAGTNSISGEFSLQAEGFIIEAGEKSRPIQNFVVSGNFYKMLNNIEELADDIYFGGGSLGSPSIWVKELIIAGE